MSRRIRCDCKLRGLPEVQRVKVNAWLFEEGFTYEEVVEACLSEFGLKVSKSSVGRYYQRISADRFARIRRENWEEKQPKLSPAEAYKELLRRIAILAWEEMDQPLKDINHKTVVRLVRVLIAARREKHQETRVSVERRKVENWLARECLRHWRREMKKQPQMSYLPLSVDGKPQLLNSHTPHPDPLPGKGRGGWASTPPQRVVENTAPPLSGSLPAQSPRGERDGRPWRSLTTKGCSLTQERSAIEGGRVASKQLSTAESPELLRHECRAPEREARDVRCELMKTENRSTGGTPHLEKTLDFIHRTGHNPAFIQ